MTPTPNDFTIKGTLDLDTEGFRGDIRKISETSTELVKGLGATIVKLAMFNQVLELANKFIGFFAELERYSAPIRYIFVLLERVTQGLLLNLAKLMEPLIVELGKLLTEIITIAVQLMPLLRPIIDILVKVLSVIVDFVNAIIEAINYIRTSIGLEAIDTYSLASQGAINAQAILGAIGELKAERARTGKIESVTEKLSRGDPTAKSWVVPIIREATPTTPRKISKETVDMLEGARTQFGPDAAKPNPDMMLFYVLVGAMNEQAKGNIP